MMGMSEQNRSSVPDDECTVHSHPVPPSELARYSVDRDADSEQDIARYVEIEASDEKVEHVERVKREVVLGDAYDIWDVTTDKNRWWVITNMTNLYAQQHFPSLDYTISFHIGLMMRLKSRPAGADAEEPSPFDEVFRRQEQPKNRYDDALEAEDYQAVGMQLRECLISLISSVRRRLEFPPGTEFPQDANFVGWSILLTDMCCPGSSNKELRQYLKSAAKDTWQLANWITHHRNANATATTIAIHACDTIVGHFVQMLVREKTENIEQCPLCKSRNVRTHFDHTIESDGEYYMTCGVCKWTTHPVAGEAAEPGATADGGRDPGSN
jgi:hypothetical protein